MKNYILSFIAAIVLSIVLSPIRGYFSMELSVLSGFVAFFILSFLFFKKLSGKPNSVFFFMLLGVLIFEVPLRWGNLWNKSLITLPDPIFHILGIISGYFVYKFKAKWKYILPALFSIAAVFMYFNGLELWLHKINFGTFTGKILQPVPMQLVGLNQKSEKINLSSSNKYVMLDFWHTKCGYCFEAFPTLDKIYKENISDTNLLIFAVNKKLKTDSATQGLNMIKKLDYSFPLLFPEIDSLPEVFGIEVYPTTLLIDPQGNIIFKGELKNCYNEYKSRVAKGN
jgi:thiol-disulfide isomerase/thioredoxin